MAKRTGALRTENPSLDVRLTINTACNHRCLFCDHNDGDDLTIAEVKRIIEDLRRKNPDEKMLVITGGEPTLSPVLVEAVRHAKKLGFDEMMMTTNGRRLADTGFCDRLKKAGLGRLNFSLHATRARTFDAITRTKGGFPKVLRGLENAASRFETHVNMVINRQNYRDVLDMVRLLSSIQERTKSTLRLMPSIVVIEGDSRNEFISWADISIENSKIAPYLAEAARYDRAQPRRIIVDQFGGLCFMPLCACREHPELLSYAPRGRFTESIAYLQGDCAAGSNGARRIKAARCRSCRLDPVCTGVAPGYAALYGLSELVPL